MDLCIEFGEPNPEHLIKRLGNDGRKLAEWRAYYELSPFGYRRHNMHAIYAAMPFLRAGTDPSSLMIDDTTGELDEVYAEYQRIKAEREAEGLTDGHESRPL